MEATPEDRDRYVDLLRGLSILVVVLGHWLISVVIRTPDGVTGTSALGDVRALQLATWVLQVMPVFFFVGGFSNLLGVRQAARRGWGYRDYLHRRVVRLVRPTGIFVGVWLLAALVLERTPISPASVRFVAGLAAQPLWFLAVYLIVVALAPPLAAVHDRWPWAPFVVLPVLVGALDAGRLAAGQDGLALANYGLVFLFAQQVGFLYGDGWFAERSRRSLLVAAGGAFVVLVALTTVGPYPVSMVGVPGAALSNMSPPTVCILVLTVAQVGAAMALAPAARRALAGRRAWTATVLVNARIMTLFLWHLSAIVAVGGAAWAAGLDFPAGGSAAWWAGRPVWVLVSAVVLAGLVAVFGRFESPPRQEAPPSGPGVAPTLLAVVAALAIIRGLIGVAMSGFSPVLEAAGEPFLGVALSPLADAVLIVGGAVLLQMPWLSRRRPPPQDRTER